MRIRVGEIREQDMWDEVRQGLENLVRGVLPQGYFPGVSPDSEPFREWARNFIRNTNHIEWFCHDIGRFQSWLENFIERIRQWENEHPNPVLNSNDVLLLLQRILMLRSLINEDLLLEQNYQNLKIENAIQHYKLITVCFLVMGGSSVVLPLLMLLLPSLKNAFIISWLGFLCFLISSITTVWYLIKSATQ